MGANSGAQKTVRWQNFPLLPKYGVFLLTWLAASATGLLRIWPAQRRGTGQKSVSPHPHGHAFSVTLMPSAQQVIMFLGKLLSLTLP